MESVPLAARLVEVIADRGEATAERYRYGSGCMVSGRTVLTAAHVVAGAQSVRVRDPHKRLYSATVDPRFVAMRTVSAAFRTCSGCQLHHQSGRSRPIGRRSASSVGPAPAHAPAARP